MSSRKLPNYLRMHRKRAGLSQDEVAFLLGCRTGAKVSRYERFARRPSLETAFAYEVIFGVPPKELLAGVYDEIRETTAKRAQALAERLNAVKPDRMTARKLEAFRAMVSPTNLAA